MCTWVESTCRLIVQALAIMDRTLPHTNTHTHVLTHLHTRTRTHTHTRTRTHIHTHTHTYTPVPTYSLAHTCLDHTHLHPHAQLNEPSAIMEMKVDKAGGAGADVIRFEMSAAQVADMVTQVDAIEAQIASLTA